MSQSGQAKVRVILSSEVEGAFTFAAISGDCILAGLLS